MLLSVSRRSFIRANPSTSTPLLRRFAATVSTPSIAPFRRRSLSSVVRPSASALLGSTTTPSRSTLKSRTMATHIIVNNGHSSDASRPNAPSPFIVAPGPALDHLLQGYQLRPESNPPYAVFEHEIENSPNDDRQHRLIMLQNGMEVLLISDPKADKAAAAMDVKVGHLSDPEDLQGLAHFCEHLMFMGTEKYPKENDYTEFLTQHSGSSNAFTGLDQTCYYFDVEPSSLAPALDRFAQFFISPLFDPSCTEREANAVHSENSKNLQSDMWRFFQLDKSTSSKTHAYWRFGTGNKESLGFEPVKENLDVRKRLIEWQEKHYSANLCKLVVLAKDPLDELTRTVVEKFSPAPNRNLPVPDFPGSPYTSDELQRTIYVKSVKDSRQLELTFPFPDESAFYATKPGSFLSHLIGHEGEGSILSLLKKKGWANSMSAGAGNGAIGFEFFKVHVDLTAEGLSHHEDVSAIIFAYFDLLRSTPPAEWAFQEVSQLSKLAFRFKEKGSPTNTAMGLALSMSRPFPRAKLLSAPWLSTEWNPEIVQDLIAKLTPENCRIMVSAQQPIEGKAYELKEYWYGTEYTIEPMSEKLLKPASAKEFPELHLPKPNAFVPTDLEIKNKVEVEKPAKRPLSLRKTPIARLWHKKDDRWWVPRAGVFILIRSPLIDDTALHSVQSRLVTELVRDALAEYSYDAELAGLSYTFEMQGDGIILTLDGYNDKLPLLAQVVLDKLKNFEIDPERFEIIMDQLRRAYVNNRLDQPYNHAMFTAGYLCTELLWTREQQLSELSNVTVSNLSSYKSSLFSRGHIEMLVHGNMLKDEAISLCKMVEQTLDLEPLTPDELRSHRALIPPLGKTLTRSPVFNTSNDQSAIEQMTYVGNIYDDYDRCKLSLFATLVSEPLFDQLRTREQLGYIVSSGVRRSIGFMAFRVIVQSDRDASYVEERIEHFWTDYLPILESMSEDEFAKYRRAVIAKKLEDHKNMWDESSFFWLLIQSGWYDFEQRTREAEILATLTKDDLIEFFKRHFLTDSNKRRISVHLHSQRLESDRLAQLGPLIQELGLPVPPPEEMQKLVASRPTIEQIKAFAQPMLQQAGKDDATIASILHQIERVLTTRTSPDDVNLIEEGEREGWKRTLEKGPYATPTAEYSDLIQKM